MIVADGGNFGRRSLFTRQARGFSKSRYFAALHYEIFPGFMLRSVVSAKAANMMLVQCSKPEVPIS
jgi:hypothetical protein